MNDKIRELAVEAGLGRERWNTTTQFEAFLQKFGELIIQECTGVVEKQKVFDTGYDRTQAIKHDALLVGYDDCATGIIHGFKEHFGVE